MKRPLVIFGSVYAAGILAAHWLDISFWLVCSIGLSLSLLTVCWAKARPWLLLPLVFLGGASNYQFHNTPFSADDLRNLLPAEAQIATLRGKLCETPSLRVFEQDQQESWRTLARIDVSALRLNRKDWQPAIGRVAVTTPAAITNMFGGQIVEVTGVLAPP